MVSHLKVQFIIIKFIFSKKATKIDKIFTVDLTLYSKSLSIFVAVLENMNFKLL